MRLLKSALFVVIVSAFFVSGCKSSASIAYQIDHATERSKYVRETYLDTAEMEALKKYSSELESKVLDVDFNDASLTYGIGVATDNVTGLAVAGSASGLLAPMSDLSMGVFAFSAIFDSSHLERARLYRPGLFVVRERSEKNDNIKRKSLFVKGFVEDIQSTYSELNDAIVALAEKNGWEKATEWEKLKKGASDGYKNTGICPEDEVLYFWSHYYRKSGFERGHSVYNGVLEGEKIGNPGHEYNVLSIGWSPFCAPAEKEDGSDLIKGTAVAMDVSTVLAIKLSKMTGEDSALYFYIPPSKQKGGFPIPALANNGEIYWMASIK